MVLPAHDADSEPFSAGLTPTDLVSAVAREIAAAVIEGRLAPGERLGEERVARALGVSRAPVREAARQLVQRGLLVAIPRRGFFVRALSLHEVDDLYDLRLTIERHAALRILDHGPEGAADVLEACVESLKQAAQARDERAMIEGDLRFHRLICELSGNARLLKLFDDLADELRLVIHLIGQLYDDPDRMAATHEPVVAAIRARDAAAVDAAVSYHIGVAWREVRRLFEAATEGP